MALPVPSSMLKRAIAETVPFTTSLPSNVVNTSFPTAVPSTIDTTTLSVPVKLIASVVFGKVIVPFPESVNRMWVWFIGVWLIVICLSRRTGCGESSSPSGGSVVVVVVASSVVVVVAVADVGVAIIILDAAKAIIIATVKIVATAVLVLMMYLLSLFFLLRCFISVPSTTTIDKRFPLSIRCAVPLFFTLVLC